MGTGLRAVLYMWSCCLTPHCVWVSDRTTLLLQMSLCRIHTSSYTILNVGSYYIQYTICTFTASYFISFVWWLFGLLAGGLCTDWWCQQKRGSDEQPWLTSQLVMFSIRKRNIRDNGSTTSCDKCFCLGFFLLVWFSNLHNFSIKIIRGNTSYQGHFTLLSFLIKTTNVHLMNM